MNWNPINQVIDDMKHKYEVDGELLLQELRRATESVEKMYEMGYPETEILTAFDGKTIGIPIELASIIRLVFQFSADHGIDLVDALSTSNLTLAS